MRHGISLFVGFWRGGIPCCARNDRFRSLFQQAVRRKGDLTMKLFKVLTAIGSLALLALALTPGLKAENDVWNKKTTLKFSQPFEIPGGQVLPAGTYVFKLLDSPYDRDIVQIFNQDQTHIYATIMA